MPNIQFQDLAPYYDELMDIVPYDFWAEYVLTLLDFVDYQPKTLLDCACGTGNLSYELARHGLEITGIDLSYPMIQEALKKASQTEPLPSVKFFQGNLTSFNLGRTFDAATCLYDSLNYILTIEDLRNAFACIRQHLNPGGIFIFDLNSIWAFEANLFSQKSRNPHKRLQYEWQAHFNESSRICTVNMDFITKQGKNEIVFHETHQERAYSIDEIEELVTATGWQMLHVFDAYTLNRPRHRSERWFFVLRVI